MSVQPLRMLHFRAGEVTDPDVRELRSQCAQNPDAAAFEIETLRGQVADLQKALGAGPAKFDMSALARSFPSFAGSNWPGLVPEGGETGEWLYYHFDHLAFFEHAAKNWGELSHGHQLVVSFLADVWNGNACKAKSGSSTKASARVMGVPKFDLYEALLTWDRAHRAAFIAWAKEPWFP